MTSQPTASDAFTVLAFLGVCAWLVWKTVAYMRRMKQHVMRDQRRTGGFCEQCGYDLRGTDNRPCPECGRDGDEFDEEEPSESSIWSKLDAHALRDNWPATPVTPIAPAVNESFVAVHTTQNVFEADLLSQQLGARGVWARVERNEERLGGSYRRIAHLTVMVPSKDEHLARTMIDAFRRKPVDPVIATDGHDA